MVDPIWEYCLPEAPLWGHSCSNTLNTKRFSLLRSLPFVLLHPRCTVCSYPVLCPGRLIWCPESTDTSPLTLAGFGRAKEASWSQVKGGRFSRVLKSPHAAQPSHCGLLVPLLLGYRGCWPSPSRPSPLSLSGFVSGRWLPAAGTSPEPLHPALWFPQTLPVICKAVLRLVIWVRYVSFQCLFEIIFPTNPTMA